MAKYNYALFVHPAKKHNNGVTVVIRAFDVLGELVQHNMLNNRTVSIFKTKEKATHNNLAAAKAYIEVCYMMPEEFF